jgi:hypothetical protein
VTDRSGIARARTRCWLTRHLVPDDSPRSIARATTPIPAPPRAYVYPRLSPDGRLLALDVRDEPDGVWLWDFARERLTPVSVGRASDIAPVCHNR